MHIRNRNPLANALNDRFYSNVDYSQVQQGGYYKANINAQLPDPLPLDFSMLIDNLHTPNQDIPLGDRTAVIGFIGNSSLFRVHDGTILDFKTGRIVKKAAVHKEDEIRYISHPDDSRYSSWNNNDIFNIDDINNLDSSNALSKEDIAYWKLAEEESKKLEATMTSEQKQMLAELEKEGFFKTRLIEESKKNA